MYQYENKPKKKAQNDTQRAYRNTCPFGTGGQLRCLIRYSNRTAGIYSYNYTVIQCEWKLIILTKNRIILS